MAEPTERMYALAERGLPLQHRTAHINGTIPGAGNLTIAHTKGHAGDTLNEGADALALVGMRWGRDGLTKPQVRDLAHNIAEGFLAQWRCR